MNYNHTYLREGKAYNDLSARADLLLGGQSKGLNITINSKEAVEHFDWFQRQLFLSDLLDIHGIFIVGALKDDQFQAMSDLYSKTKFSFLGHWLYQNTISLTDMKTIDDRVESEEFSLSNNVRTIICWNGNEQLTPDDQIHLHFDAGDVVGAIVKIQKVIQTDFTGSTFGVNALNPGQVGTVSILLEADIEKVLYTDNHTKGFFVIMDERESLQLGIGIIIKE
ncbi:MAG: hypothetical protein ACI8XB_000736 [Patiriisocius sp.]|jgi:hypothetical protein